MVISAALPSASTMAPRTKSLSWEASSAKTEEDSSSSSSRFSCLGSVGTEVEEAYVSLIGELYLATNSANEASDPKKTAHFYIKSRNFIDKLLSAAFRAASRTDHEDSLGAKLKRLRALSVSVEGRKSIQTGIAHMQVLHQLGKVAKLTDMVTISPSSAANICLAALEPVTQCLENIVQALSVQGADTRLRAAGEYESDSDCSSCTTHSSLNEDPVSATLSWAHTNNVVGSPSHSLTWSPMISPSPLHMEISKEPAGQAFSSSFSTLDIVGSSGFLSSDPIGTPTYLSSTIDGTATPPYLAGTSTPPAIGSPPRSHASPIARAPPGLPKPDGKGVIGRRDSKRFTEPLGEDMFVEISRKLLSQQLGGEEEKLHHQRVKMVSQSSFLSSGKPGMLNRRHSTPVIIDSSSFRGSPGANHIMSPTSSRSRGASLSSRADGDGEGGNKKGQLCKYGLINQCKYDSCWRAHSIEEVVKYNEFFRTHKCHKGETNCKNGAACSYYHSEDQRDEADRYRALYHGWTTANPPAHLSAPSPMAFSSADLALTPPSSARSVPPAPLQRRQSALGYLGSPPTRSTSPPLSGR